MLKTALISAAIAAVLSGAVVHRVTADHAQVKYDKLATSIQRANTAARAKGVQIATAQTQLSVNTAVAEGQAQERIVYKTRTIIEKVPQYVTVTQDRACVSYGLVRVLDAAAQGRDPAELQLPAGKSDDACSPVKASDLARNVAENYGISRQNSEQLDALILDIRQRVAIANGVQP